MAQTGQAIIDAEGTGLRFVADGPDDPNDEGYGFLYSFTEAGPFCTTALVVLGLHNTRARELAGQLNSMLSATTPAPASARKELTAGHSFSWRVDYQAPGGLFQAALLVEPTPASRQLLLSKNVIYQTDAFAAAGEEARVLLLVPLLRSEGRAMSCRSEGPERGGLHFALAKELAEALVQPPMHAGCQAGRRVFGPVTPMDFRWLFMDGQNRAFPPPAPLEEQQQLPCAAAVVAGMAPALRASLHAHFRRLFPVLPAPPPATPASIAAWAEFEGCCSGGGLLGLSEACLYAREGEAAVFMVRVLAIGLELQRFFGA